MLDLKTFANKECKLAAQKKVSFWTNFSFLSLTECFSLHLTVFLPPLPEVQCPNISDFQNSWGKGMERNGVRKLLLIRGVKSPRQKKNYGFFSFYTPFKRRFAPTSQSPLQLPMLLLFLANLFFFENL